MITGVDGCPSGWFAVTAGADGVLERFAIYETFPDLLLGCEGTVAIDVPIGLLSAAERGGRRCDREARKALRGARSSSVFSPPVWGALECATYARALRANRASSGLGLGISKQCWGLADKLRDVNETMREAPGLQARVYEVHPELSFAYWRGTAIAEPKRGRDGAQIRRAIVSEDIGEHALAHIRQQFHVRELADDDILDAFAALWSARRLHHGEGRALPADPPRDAYGLQMAIWV